MGRPIATDVVIGWERAHKNMDVDAQQQTCSSNMGFGPQQQKWNLHGHEPTTAWNSTDIEFRFKEILMAKTCIGIDPQEYIGTFGWGGP